MTTPEADDRKGRGAQRILLLDDEPPILVPMARYFQKLGFAVDMASERCSINTILGSCVAVCLWDAKTGVGGMNHLLLPHFAGNGSASPRLGNVSGFPSRLPNSGVGAS